MLDYSNHKDVDVGQQEVILLDLSFLIFIVNISSYFSILLRTRTILVSHSR